jgi:hypothetical protein
MREAAEFPRDARDALHGGEIAGPEERRSGRSHRDELLISARGRAKPVDD